MKICFVVSVYPRHHEDSEVPWLRRTVNYLREAGHDIVVFAPSFLGLKSHTIDGCRVERFRYFFAPLETLTHDEGAPNKIHKFHYKIITLFYIFSGIINLTLFHRRERFDALHVHWPAPHALFAYGAAACRRTRIILTFYTADVMLVKRFPFVKYFLRWFIRHAHSVIGISSFTKKLVTDICERPVHIIPYGTAISERREFPPFEPNHKILSVGRVIERKGFAYLIKAMPLILQRWPDATLTIAGGGPLREELVGLTKTLALETCVFLPGKIPQDTLEKLFEECNVFVLSSIIDSKGDTEGLGVVLIEAMTLRKPVVATGIGGIVDIVEDKKTGLLVPQRDPAALAEAVSSIFSNHAEAQRIAARGYEHIQNNFSWPSVIRRFNNVYASLNK